MVSGKPHRLPSVILTRCRHTSVVAYGKEVFYGQGIFEATPGKTVVRC